MQENEKIVVQYFDLFIQANGTGDFASAESNLSSALSILETLPRTNVLWAYYFLNRASMLNNQGLFDLSIENSHNAKNVIPIKGHDDLNGNYHLNLATSQMNIGDYADASINIDKAVFCFKKCKKLEKVAEGLIIKGEIILKTGEWSEAIKLVSEALAIARKNAFEKTEAKTLMTLGFIFRAHRYFYLAIDHYRDAERVFKKMQYSVGEYEAIYERANTWMSIGKHEETIKLIAQLEGILPENSPIHIYLIRLKYQVFNKLKEFDKALEKANMLLDIFTQAKDKVGISESILNIGNVHYNKREMDLARDKANEAKKIASEIGDKQIQGNCDSLLYDIDNFSE